MHEERGQQDRVIGRPERVDAVRELESVTGHPVEAETGGREVGAEQQELRPQFQQRNGAADAFRRDAEGALQAEDRDDPGHHVDRKSTRLNSSHLVISYAVFCLKKKKETVTLTSA